MIKTSFYTGMLLVMLACRSGNNSEQNKDMDNTTSTTNSAQTMQPQSIYDFEFKTLDGQKIVLNEYKGRKILIVNTASECGYTPQYKELQALYEQYSSKVVVLGFPANNFGGQEPGSNQEIAAFCEKNYGVKFPIMEKVSVTGSDADPLFKYLSDRSVNGVTDEKPTWNFCKYLIDEKGKIIKFFPSKVKPMSDEIISAINS
jgi:glutathione peroxidase